MSDFSEHRVRTHVDEKSGTENLRRELEPKRSIKTVQEEPRETHSRTDHARGIGEKGRRTEGDGNG